VQGADRQALTRATDPHFGGPQPHGRTQLVSPYGDKPVGWPTGLGTWEPQLLPVSSATRGMEHLLSAGPRGEETLPKLADGQRHPGFVPVCTALAERLA